MVKKINSGWLTDKVSVGDGVDSPKIAGGCQKFLAKTVKARISKAPR